MFLNKDELKELTGKITYTAQSRVLNGMGISFKVRADGTLAVLKDHVISEFGGHIAKQHTQDKIEPNWASVN